MDWDDEGYKFKLIVDGEEQMEGLGLGELRAEAERIGAELEETHTP